MVRQEAGKSCRTEDILSLDFVMIILHGVNL
jgi:hypothetical protein